MSRDVRWICSHGGRSAASDGACIQSQRGHGPVWYAKYRLPDGRQVQKKLGPTWTERGRPPVGWLTKWTAEAWLRDVLDHAATRHAAWACEDRRNVRRRRPNTSATPRTIGGRKPSTLRGSPRSAVLAQDGALFLTPAFTACGCVSCWRCAGATSISSARRSGAADYAHGTYSMRIPGGSAASGGGRSDGICSRPSCAFDVVP